LKLARLPPRSLLPSQFYLLSPKSLSSIPALKAWPLLRIRCSLIKSSKQIANLVCSVVFGFSRRMFHVAKVATILARRDFQGPLKNVAH